MAKFRVYVTETVSQSYLVDAEDGDEAENIVNVSQDEGIMDRLDLEEEDTDWRTDGAESVD